LQTISLGNVGGTVPGFVISGWQAGEESGTSVSSAGDFNGDGKADMLVSAYFNDTAGTNAGMTYVVLGKTGNVAIDLENIKNNVGGFAIKGENISDFSGVSGKQWWRHQWRWLGRYHHWRRHWWLGQCHALQRQNLCDLWQKHRQCHHRLSSSCCQV